MIDAKTVTSPVTANEHKISFEELMFQVINEKRAIDLNNYNTYITQIQKPTI